MQHCLLSLTFCGFFQMADGRKTSSRGRCHKANKSKSSCCVPLCDKPGYMVEGGRKITFHSFPKDEKTIKSWIVKIRRDLGPKFKLTQHTKICSRHFLDTDFRITFRGRKFLKEGVVPSVFPWTKGSGMWPQLREQNLPDFVEEMSHPEEGMDLENSLSDTEGLCPKDARIDELEQQLEAERMKNETLTKEKALLQHLLMEKQEEGSRRSFCLERFKNSDEDVCFYTGFPTYNSLRLCLHYLNPGENGENVCYVYSEGNAAKKGDKRRTLQVEDEFFLTLVQLRLGLFDTDIAHRFCVSKSTVQFVVTSWVSFMYQRLGKMYIWPTQEAIRNTMPESMTEKYPAVEWILDAFEIECERPSSSVLQAQSLSNHKRRNIVKGLIACMPSGQLGFISQLYTGSISDHELTIRSGFLQMPHNKGAVWLADKAFQIQDLADRLGVTVNVKAFIGNRQQASADEVCPTQQVVASERIHIEHAINKVKNFHIFDRPIPLSMKDLVNQMWMVCGLLTLWQSL